MNKCNIKLNNFDILNNILIADTFIKRLVGLLKHKQLSDGEGLLISKCKQIHTLGMKFNIDAIFLTENGKIIYIERNMRPGIISKYFKNAFWVLELKSGSADDLNLLINETLLLDIF